MLSPCSTSTFRDCTEDDQVAKLATGDIAGRAKNIGKAVGVQLTLKGPKIIIMVKLLTEFSSTLAQQEAGRALPEAGRAQQEAGRAP